MSRNSRRAVAIAVAGVFAVGPMVTACAAGSHPETALPTQLVDGVNASANQVAVRNVFVLGSDPGRQLTAGGSAPLYAWFVNHAATPDKLVAVDAPGLAKSVRIPTGGLDLPPGRLVSTIQTGGAPGSGTPSPGGPAVIGTPTPGATPTSRTTPTPRVTPTPVTPASGTPGAPTRHPLTSGSASPGVPGSSASATPLPATPTGGTTGAAQNASQVVLTGLAADLPTGATVRLTLHFQQAGVVTLNVPVESREGDYATYAPAAATAPPAMPAIQSAKGKASAAPKTSKARKAKRAKKATPAPSA